MTSPISAPTYGTFRWFMRAIGRYLGFSDDQNAWNHAQESTAQEVLDSALNKFYFPPAVEAMSRSHAWSFMRPVGRLQTAANQQYYLLPPDFESIDGDLTYDVDEEHFPPVSVVSEQRIRGMTHDSTASSYPLFAAVRPRVGEGLVAQQQEILFWPIPDSEYRLTYRYNALPIRLTDTYQYPLGGVAYAEAIKGACLAEAELLQNRQHGPMFQSYLGLLASAVATDLRRAPDLIGYNGDLSTMSDRGLSKSIRKVRDFLWTNATYNSGT